MPRKRALGQRRARICRRRAAEHMQAVADGEVLDVAKLRVELGDGDARRILARHAAVGCEARAPRTLQDLRFDQRQPAAVDAVRLGIFLQQAFQLGQRPVQSGGAQRRRQVADGDGADAALGLHRLAGVVDDERVDDRQWAEQRLRKACFRQRERLAGQPFERAVRAEVHQRVDALLPAQRRVERDVGVTRRTRGVVIAVLAIFARASVRLQHDDDVAGAQAWKAEGAVDAGRVVASRPPGFADGGANARRQPGQMRVIGAEGELDVLAGVAGQRGEDFGGRARCIACRISGFTQQIEDFARARRRVEPAGVTRAAAARRVVRQHDREPPLSAGRCAQARPCAGETGDEGDPVFGRLMQHTGVFERSRRAPPRP